MDIRYVLGAANPVGSLTFQDKALKRKVQSTSIDSLTIAGSRATITGRATVDGVPGVGFTVDVEDLGKAGADTFRIVLADGYAAAGVLTKGNISVERRPRPRRDRARAAVAAGGAADRAGAAPSRHRGGGVGRADPKDSEGIAEAPRFRY